MRFPVAVKHGENTNSLGTIHCRGRKPLWLRTVSAPERDYLLSGLNKHQEWSMPSKPYQLWVFQTSHPGAEPQGGIAGPAPLSPAMGVLSWFKFVQTDILTGNEIHWKVGCLHQWDPLEKAPSSSQQQGWPSREPKESSYLWSLVSFWFRVCLTFWSLSKFDFCQVFFWGGGKTCKWVVLVGGYSRVGRILYF